MAEQLPGQMELFDFINEQLEEPQEHDFDILSVFSKTGSKFPFSRKWLCQITGLADRTMRRLLHEARKKIPIINLQNGKGYFIPDMNLEKDRKMLARWVKQEKSRIKESQIIVDVAERTLRNCGVDIEEASDGRMDKSA